MRDNWLSNRVFLNADDLLDHCCEAWNKLRSQPSHHVHRNARVGLQVLVIGVGISYPRVPML